MKIVKFLFIIVAAATISIWGCGDDIPDVFEVLDLPQPVIVILYRPSNGTVKPHDTIVSIDKIYFNNKTKAFRLPDEFNTI